MNKELILKYKAEFDHWVAGGQLLYTYPSIIGWQQCKADHPWCSTSNTYIIKDSYVEFRKALAENKAIERYYGHSTGEPIWVDSDATDMLSFDVKHIRVKPDKPKFEVGDWLIEIHNRAVHKVLETFTTGDVRVRQYEAPSTYTTETSDFVLWKPQQGEYIWDCDFGIARVIDVTDSEGILCRDCFGDKMEFTTKLTEIEPFIGNLPTSLTNK